MKTTLTASDNLDDAGQVESGSKVGQERCSTMNLGPVAPSLAQQIGTREK
jgi:hypothetical protein